jgi:hypothetical protein
MHVAINKIQQQTAFAVFAILHLQCQAEGINNTVNNQTKRVAKWLLICLIAGAAVAHASPPRHEIYGQKRECLSVKNTDKGGGILTS